MNKSQFALFGDLGIDTSGAENQRQSRTPNSSITLTTVEKNKRTLAGGRYHIRLPVPVEIGCDDLRSNT